MKKCHLTIIYQTKSQKNLSKFIEEIKSITQFKNPEIEKYYKIKESYKITFLEDFDMETDPISFSVLLTSKICSPWLIYLRNDGKEVELIFDKNDRSSFQKNNFNSMIWSNFLIE